jgi:hypothetical protein
MSNGFDPPLNSLPQPFRSCLPPNPQSTACDKLIGNLVSGNGYCAIMTPDPNYPGSAPYALTTYCSCVNSKIPCPMIASATCSNSAFSYKNASQLPDSEEYKYCMSHPICVNLIDPDGRQDVIYDVVQDCNTIESTPADSIDYKVMIFIFIILIVIIFIFYRRQNKIKSYILKSVNQTTTNV